MNKETRIDLKKAMEKNIAESVLAERLGVSHPYLNAVSSGKKNVIIKQLERIADALGMRLRISFEDPG